MIRTFAAALLCFLTVALAHVAVAATPRDSSPPRVAALDWMSGTWTHKAEGRETVSESWLGPGNGLMVAANLTTWPNGRKSFEFLRIAETADGFSYYASPGGKSPVEFRLKETGDRRVVFENPAHDFPQRILYWRDGEELVARIEGTIKGKARSEQWRFSRR
jgi:hypothetical protein